MDEWCYNHPWMTFFIVCLLILAVHDIFMYFFKLMIALT